MTAEEFIKKHTSSRQRERLGGGWGLVLDEIVATSKHIPPKYLGASFYEMDHAEIARFFRMSDDEKFLYAYWAERLNAQRSGKMGVILGSGATIAAVFILLSILSLLNQ